MLKERVRVHTPIVKEKPEDDLRGVHYLQVNRDQIEEKEEDDENDLEMRALKDFSNSVELPSRRIYPVMTKDQEQLVFRSYRNQAILVNIWKEENPILKVSRLKKLPDDPGKYLYLYDWYEKKAKKEVLKSIVLMPAYFESKKKLSKTEKVQYQNVCNDSDDLYSYIFNCNKGLVINIAQKHLGRGMPLDDLVQEGYEVLKKAIEKFDVDRDLKFSTYATWWLKQGIGRSIHARSRMIRLPVGVEQLLGWIERIVKQHQRETSGEYLDRDTLRQLLLEDRPDESIITIDSTLDVYFSLLKKVTSLDKTINDDDSKSLGELIPDESIGDPGIINISSRESLIAAAKECIEIRLLQKTNSYKNLVKNDVETYMTIFLERVYADTENRKSLELVGQLIGKTRERARQLEAELIRWLKQDEKFNDVLLSVI